MDEWPEIKEDKIITTELPPPNGTVDEEVRRIWRESEERVNRRHNRFVDKMKRELL